MDDLFLILGALFAIGMMVLMVKYAKFIHVQPKVEAELMDNVHGLQKMKKLKTSTPMFANKPDFY